MGTGWIYGGLRRLLKIKGAGSFKGEETKGAKAEELYLAFLIYVFICVHSIHTIIMHYIYSLTIYPLFLTLFTLSAYVHISLLVYAYIHTL